MPIHSIKETSKSFEEPYRSIIELVDESINMNYLENFVVYGNYDGKEKTYMNALLIAGLAPNYSNFLTAFLSSGKADDMPFWEEEMKDLIPFIENSKELGWKRLKLISEGMHACLGKNKHHIAGMLSLHQTVQTKKSFGVLWKKPSIDRTVVEKILTYTLKTW